MTATINSQKLALLKSIYIKNSLNESFKDQDTDKLAGFLQNGKLAWIAIDGILRVVSTQTGAEVAYYNFAKHHGTEGCMINHVEEVTYLQKVCILAVSIEFTNSPARASMVCIFCIQGCKLLGSMDMSERITCCKYITADACRRSVLRQFHGTLAIGTDQGKLFLVDLMIPNDTKEIILSPSYDTEIFPMINIQTEMEQIQILHHHKKAVASRETGEKCFFSIHLKQVLEETGAILSMLCMPNLYMMAVGLDDGRMILYDLIDLQAFHLAYPPGNRAPLTHMSYIEPTDDPRCAVYVWSFHSSKDGAIAVMHSIMFDAKNNGFYENFRSCSVRLTMPIFYKDTFPICCRSVTKPLTQEEEDILTINLLAWTSPTRNCTNVMVFDLNQWYKEEMPNVGDWRSPLKYAVVFEVSNLSLDVVLNEKSLLPFNSIMRPEEHFYPNSLSFDVVLLETDKFSHFRWNGLQNIVLQQFNIVGPQMILEPSFYYNELMQVAIVPQFYDVNFSIATPLELKREFLLSVALEYNFTGFLKKCAWAWADGSYLGKDGSVGIGLSTLTEWIWSRVRVIKDVCNNLCQPLFDYSEQRIDYGTQKQLSMCCKQLKILSDLLQMISRDYQKFIPENILSQLQTQANTVKMASDYQEVLQWLLNVGLLPEGHSSREETDDNEFVIVPYPYRAIASHYENQRSKLSDTSDHEEKPVKYLFIDAFIENECCSYEALEWDCLYPPKSIQSLLRSLLVPDIPIENKYVIFIYLFMDITNALNESCYSSIVRNLIKFPAVFKINPAVIKRTQAFWNLDNGQLDTAVEELISPLLHDRYLPQWQRELFIGALLKQNANSLALRVLRCPGNPISSDLEVTTLLANNLISEALKIQRASGDNSLLEKLFHKILHSANYEQLLELALNEKEGKVLRDYLQNSDLSNSVNLHFVYLLQRSKFIDAAQLMDSFTSVSSSNINLEPPKQVLNAYYSTMDPITKKLTSIVYADDPVHVKEVPSPFSVNLIKSRCNASTDIYKKCVQSITEANYDSVQEVKEMPFIGSPKLGIFEYRQPTVQMQEVSYPMELNVNEHGKRENDNNNGIFRMDDFEGPKLKKQRLEDVIEPSNKKLRSYADKRISLLTNFKNRRPRLNFSSRTPSTSSRVTPERVAIFGDLLTTPLIEKKTPQKFVQDRATTPASILKTRSCRSSISPTHSRFSEFDDNKSVKSITFAALPGTNDSSLQDSSYLDESFGGEQQQMDSSAEFYSPEKSPIIVERFTSNVSSKSSEILIISSSSTIASGPKPRPPIKSRSATPESKQKIVIDPSTKPSSQVDLLDEINKSTEIRPIMESPPREERMEEVMKPSEIAAQSTGIAPIADTVVNESDLSDLSGLASFPRKSVLKADFEPESDVSSDDDGSDYNIVRKSILPDTFVRQSSSSSSISTKESCDDDDIAEDEHFEEEELPEHSDYDDENEDSDPDSFEYGNVDLDDSDEDFKSSESRDSLPKGQENQNEIIEIPDSDDDDDVQIQNEPAPLPSINTVVSQQTLEIGRGIEENSNEERREILELASEEINAEDSKPAESEEQMIDILYDDIQETEEEIESPPFENISPPKSKSPFTPQNINKQEGTELLQEAPKIVAKEIKEPYETVSEEIKEAAEIHPPESSEAVSETFKEHSKEPSEAIVSVSEHVQTVTEILTQQTESVTEDGQQRFEPEPEAMETEAFDDIQLVEEVQQQECLSSEAEKEPVESQPTEKVAEPVVMDSVDLKSADVEGNNHDIQPAMEITVDPSSDILNERIDEQEILQNASEMSEDVSFASAQNELNEAVIASSNNTLVAVTEIQEQPDLAGLPTVVDESNIMDKAIVYDDLIEEVVEEENISEIPEQEVTNPLEVAQLDVTVENDETGTEKMETAENITFEDKSESNLNVLEVARIDESQNDSQTEIQKSQDQDDKEIEKIMEAQNKSPEPMQNTPVDLSTPKRRSTRGKSTEVENLRIKRAVSEIPSSGTSSPISRSSRASSELRHNPKVLLKEKLLEKIEESPSGILTRNKSRALQSRETTPVSRAPSEEVDSIQKTPRRRRSTTATPTTPRRLTTRAASRNSLIGDEAVTSSQQIDDAKTPVEPKRKGRPPKKAASIASDDEHDDAKSTKSGRSTSSRKKEAPSSSSKISPVSNTSPSDELSVSNRRLTRSQLGVLEKSRQLAEKMSNEISESTAKLRATKSTTALSNNADDSDNDSVKSDSTTSRKGRKRKAPERLINDIETSSTTSKSSRKSKSPQKKHILSVIQEEGDSELPDQSISKGKGRRGKK